MVDERGKFRELVLKPSMVDRVRRTRDCFARNAGQSAKLGDRRTLARGIGTIASFEKSERYVQPRGGFRGAIRMNRGHDVNLSRARQ